MRRLLGPGEQNIENDLLRKLLLDQLTPTKRAILSINDDCSLFELAKFADRVVCETRQSDPATVGQPASSSTVVKPTALDNSALRESVAGLNDTVSSLSQSLRSNPNANMASFSFPGGAGP